MKNTPSRFLIDSFAVNVMDCDVAAGTGLVGSSLTLSNNSKAARTSVILKKREVPPFHPSYSNFFFYRHMVATPL